jgi:hypothetical protein
MIEKYQRLNRWVTLGYWALFMTGTASASYLFVDMQGQGVTQFLGPAIWLQGVFFGLLRMFSSELEYRHTVALEAWHRNRHNIGRDGEVRRYVPPNASKPPNQTKA